MDFQKRREGSKEHIEVSKGRGNFEVFGKLRNCIQEGSEIEFQKKRKGTKKHIEVSKGRGNFEVFGKL